ncbi:MULTISPECIES: rhamnulokinase [unclassified Enterococcus]|uniref:rhamnulokinase n=1 Tax=unclassified Enterococcus TaxID=2608891 RepID=UPI001554B21F|nr:MULTISPECIES: rhamnulokinase [unclassified Enterococcus]MBS7577683.1 rhamnulokinase [Enterococcus sp. MMGLQ5-2]MBS7584123.1 rhamnulokinase [Enterococcus sp. MMGLQ5-1]NPD11981.1 rhamnulokinase [Enterococcus sp. MMGLQ5-1]NPD37516.1 rhamnulokinase [Enterococcus sp. MMGLQ5-2]
MTDYIAVDIGASSGRLIQTEFNGQGSFEIREIHRFKNEFNQIQGTDYWNIQHLIKEILIGLEKAKKSGVESCFIGIDTWAVDYVLLDKNGDMLTNPVAYRDKRTDQAIELFQKQLDLKKLYQMTGIQIQQFNTIFQLLVEKNLANAKQLLLIPDYLGYVFTGKAVTEKTNASTMQLFNLQTKKWDATILATLGIEESLFPPLVEPGYLLGEIRAAKFPTYDLPKATFITVATHDTASAVVGIPANSTDDWAYVSSGTWSLLGVEINKGINNDLAYESNFTNEWGISNSIRFLKNIMGMWLIQEVARAQNYQYSYAELAKLASGVPGFQQFIDINDPIFLNPDNMIVAIQDYCRYTEQKVPETVAEISRCVYDNLALCYAIELEKLEEITNQKINKLHIVGGGSNNHFLNQLTANLCQIEVEAGPSEATAIGNLMVQMIATEDYANLSEARKGIQNSVDLVIFYPENKLEMQKIISAYKKFIKIRSIANEKD